MTPVFVAGILVGALCFALGCVGAADADEAIQQGQRSASRKGYLSLTLLALGLVLYVGSAAVFSWGAE